MESILTQLKNIGFVEADRGTFNPGYDHIIFHRLEAEDKKDDDQSTWWSENSFVASINGELALSSQDAIVFEDVESITKFIDKWK